MNGLSGWRRLVQRLVAAGVFGAPPFLQKHKSDFHPAKEVNALCCETCLLWGSPGTHLPGAHPRSGHLPRISEQLVERAAQRWLKSHFVGGGEIGKQEVNEEKTVEKGEAKKKGRVWARIPPR